MDPKVIKKEIQQQPAAYLLYLLLTPMNLYVENNGERNTYRIGLGVGPALAIGNMSLAASSNKNLLTELEKYNLAGKKIAKGETTYGIIGFKGTEFSALGLRRK